jgi:hypothetical protein
MRQVNSIEVVEISIGLSFGRIFKVSKSGAPALLAWLLGLRRSFIPRLAFHWKGVGDTVFRLDGNLSHGVSVKVTGETWNVDFSTHELDHWIEFLIRFAIDVPETDHLDVDHTEGERDYQLTLRGDFRMPGGSPPDADRAIGLD